jgi:hypothetical protein
VQQRLRRHHPRHRPLRRLRQHLRPARSNAAATCATNTCGYRCNAGFGDCDTTPSNGCEANLNASAQHCGACGNACNLANATAACSNGQCAVGACSAGFANCDNLPSNGCEVDTRSSDAHCGACNNACGGNQRCVNARCELRCVPGAATFDGDGQFRALVIPQGCAQITVRAWGGGGGGGGWSNTLAVGGNGGGGGFVRATLTVTPGETLNVVAGTGGAGACQGCGVQPAGGTPGGGTGGRGDTAGANGGPGGGGGGASRVLRGSAVLVVAGGGGGGGGGQALDTNSAGESATSGCGNGAVGATAGTGNDAPGTAGIEGGGGGGGGGAGSSVGTSGTFGRAGQGGTCAGGTAQNGSGVAPGGSAETGYTTSIARGGAAATSQSASAPAGACTSPGGCSHHIPQRVIAAAHATWAVIPRAQVAPRGLREVGAALSLEARAHRLVAHRLLAREHRPQRSNSTGSLAGLPIGCSANAHSWALRQIP